MLQFEKNVIQCSCNYADVPKTSAGKGGATMAYTISEDCIKCGACEGECPVSAISEGDATYVIDADTCISCGACAAGCPVDAIKE